MEPRIMLSQVQAREHLNGCMTEEERRRVYGLEFKFIYRSFFREGAAFFFLCFYYFIEYTRIQTIYPVLQIIPWGYVAALTTVILLPGDKLRKHPKNFLVFVVYALLLMMFISMTYAVNSETASSRGYDYLNWLIVFFITISLVTTEKRFTFFLLLFFLWNFKMSQHGAYAWTMRGFSFTGWGMKGPLGWFANSGEYGLQMSMFCIISFCYFIGTKHYLAGWRKWLVFAFPVTSFMSVLASSSRGDYLGLTAGLIWVALTVSGRRLFYGFIVASIIGIGYWAMPATMLERFSVAGEHSDYTSYTRETRWHAAYETFHEHPIIGIGLGSWVTYYSTHFPREWGPEGWGLIHNSFLTVMTEQGGIGLVMMLLLFLGMFWFNKSTRDMASRSNNEVLSWISRGLDGATVAYLLGGSFMSVFYYPFVWIQSAMIISLHVVAKRNLASFKKQEDKTLNPI